MSLHDPKTDPKTMTQIASAVSTLGFEIVDVSGFFDDILQQAADQKSTLGSLRKQSSTVETASKQVLTVSQRLSHAAQTSVQSAEETFHNIAVSGKTAQEMAAWVSELSGRTDLVNSTLNDVSKNNAQIVLIARQVNTLAINAKIEAARAGDAGRGFSVVADAINELSQQTSTAAVQISENVETLAAWIMGVAQDARDVAEKAADVLKNSEKNSQSLTEMEHMLRESQTQAQDIAKEAERMQKAVQSFSPSLANIDQAASKTTDGISEATRRIHNLIDTSESLVQANAALGNAGADTPFFTYVQSTAAQISDTIDSAIKSGRISKADMFDRNYTPIPGTDPQQVMTRFTTFLDEILPPFQEAALDVDAKVVFCAAVDNNGYLPTHNKKFSQPQSDDPVWNTANCRNRRIFDDRVGLKAGRNKEPLLMQVYRRDMGGGQFTMMKDISAPIYVQGQHWGGLRFAVTF